MRYSIRRIIQTSPFIDAIINPLRRIRRGFRAMQRDPMDIFLERISNVFIDSPRIKVSEFNGIFILSPQSDLFRRLIRDGKYEPQLVESCQKLVDRNRDVLDKSR